jgi:hypothetical protein
MIFSKQAEQFTSQNASSVFLEMAKTMARL